MNAPSGNDPENLARQKLSQACHAMDRSSRLRWVLLVCLALLTFVLGLALIDYWLILPVLWRAAGAVTLAALLVFGVTRLVRFYLRPTRLKQGALTIESTRPELGCEVSTAAEYLAGERKMEHQYEPQLAAALEAKTARVLTQSPFVGAGMVRFAVLLGILLLAALTLALIAPGGLTALERTAMPFSKAHYTSVDVKPGDLDVPVGSNAQITNIFSGRLPKDARISWAEAANAHWQTAALTVTTQGVFLHTLTNLQTDVVYRVAGNDAQSPDYKITTYVPPTVEDFNIQLSYPAYTKLPPLTQRSPDISAVRASTAQFHIQPSVALKQAKLRFVSLPELALVANPDGSWGGTLPITKDTDYWIELADAKGHPGVNEKPYHIKALPDNPPKVEISDPGKDTRSSATNKVLVKISVADDFGVDQIKLVYNKLGGEQQTIEAQRASEHNGEVIATAELDLTPMELKNYELVAYHAEATDNNTLDGPGTGKSPVYFIEITDEEASQCLCQGQGQKVNLLVIQKQIVADTTAMPADAPADKFKDMTVRQQDAAEFGRMYQDAISAGDSEAAVTEMHAALTEMELASGELEKQQRAGAIPHEENALAHLYQVVKLMPELQNMPTKPMANQKPPDPKVQVVLEAIKQKKKEQPDNKEIQDALNQAKDLARAQAGLNSAMRHPALGGGKGQGQGQAQQAPSQADSKSADPSKQAQANAQAQGQEQGEGQGQGKGQGQQASNQADSKSLEQSKQDQAQAKGQGQGQGQGEGQGQGKGQGQNTGDNQNDSNSEPQAQEQAQDSQSQPQSPSQIAQKEDQLSKEAAALAERLKRLAGNDKRVGHNAGNGAGRAAVKMAAAGKAMAQGRNGLAGEHGFQGELALRDVIDQLERVLKNQPEPTDIAHEDSPKEYDALISEYLKRLSHED